MVVPPHSPAFSSKHNASRRQVLRSTDTAAVPVLDFNTINADGQFQTNIGMNQVMQSLDVRIGAGNDLAAGVFLQAAQGSGLEDVGIDLGPDGLTGVLGGAGSGGAHHNVTVLNGHIGFDLRMAQPAPTLSGARAIG